jgi:hypothetical protein
MYFGNVSDFFFRNKEWLIKQPKFQMGGNKPNILKIGKKYYTLNVTTGQLTLIQPKLISHKQTSSPMEQNSPTLEENKKEDLEQTKKDEFPKISNIQLYNRTHTEIKERNKSNLDSEATMSYNINKEKNKSNDMHLIKNMNIFSSFDRSENPLLGDDTINIAICRNNTEDSLLSKNRNIKTSLKIKIKSNLNIDKVMPKLEKGIIKHKFKVQTYKKLENDRMKEKRILSKNNIKKLLEKRQRSNEEIKSIITNYTNNKSNGTLTNNNCSSNTNNASLNKYEGNNIKTISLKKPEKLVLNFDFDDKNPNQILKKIFPNKQSLDINKDDSSYLKIIKDQLFKDRIFNELKNRYRFYQDSDHKREVFKISKVNLKNSIILNRKEIFPPKETVQHKLFFNYINKQRQSDNENYGFDYPLLNIK